MTRNAFTIVVVGAGYAGTAFAGRLANRHRRNCRIVVVDRAPALVERIRLHQWVSGQSVPVHPYETLFAGTGVEFRQAGVRRIDPSARTVTIESDHESETIHYDRLVLATGSGDGRRRVPGAMEHSHAIATAASAARLKEELDRLDGGAEVVVCGGGLTAIETATELADARPDLRFTLVTAGEPGEGLSARGRKHLLAAFSSRGIRILGRTSIESIEADRVRAGDGAIPFDLAIWAAGFAPGALARESGFDVAPNGQLCVDSTLRSISHPEVYGIGDAAAVETLEGNVRIRMACATALPMAAHAAGNVARELEGRNPLPFRFAYQIQCISLGRRDGLVQFVHPDDTSANRVLTGRMAAVVKELVCRSTVFSLRSELRGYRLLWWPKAKPNNVLRKEAMSKC